MTDLILRKPYAFNGLTRLRLYRFSSIKLKEEQAIEKKKVEL